MTNGFVQVALGTILKYNVHMSVSLKGMKQVNNIVMKAQMAMKSELLRLFINSEVESSVVGSGPLGNTLDSNTIVGQSVLSKENHAEGAMIERRDSLVAAIEKNSTSELFSEASHFFRENAETKNQKAVEKKFG